MQPADSVGPPGPRCQSPAGCRTSFIVPLKQKDILFNGFSPGGLSFSTRHCPPNPLRSLFIMLLLLSPQPLLGKFLQSAADALPLRLSGCQGSIKLIKGGCEEAKAQGREGESRCHRGLVISRLEAEQAAFHYGELSGENISSTMKECIGFCCVRNESFKGGCAAHRLPFVSFQSAIKLICGIRPHRNKSSVSVPRVKKI